MSPRTEKQFKEIRETTKARILNESIKLFANNGYFSTSISMIAKKANISKGLMYNYFDSKDDLLKQIVYSGFKKMLIPVGFTKNELITKPTFNNMIHEMFKFFKQNVDYWKLYYSVLIQPTVFKLVEKKIFEMVMPYFEALEKYFHSQGYENPKAETRMFTAMLDGISLNYIMDSENFPIDAIEKRLIDFYKK